VAYSVSDFAVRTANSQKGLRTVSVLADRSAGCGSMEVNSNLHNRSCSTQNRGRPRNYLFDYCVSSVSFKYILVGVGRRLKGIASGASREVLEKGRLRVYKVEQNRTA